MSSKTKKSKLNNGYTEYFCKECNDVFQMKCSAKDAKELHDIDYHGLAVESIPLVAPEPVTVVKPKIVRKSKAKPAAKPAHMSLEDMIEVLVSERVSTNKAIDSANQAAKEDAELATKVDAINAELDNLRDVVLPKLMSVNEEYRDKKLIAQKQRLIATLTSELVHYMSMPEYIKGEKVKEAVARTERIKAATEAVAKDNAEAYAVESLAGKEWLEDETERFKSMVNGDVWIKRGKNAKGPERIPFVEDIWWALQTHAKHGIVDEDGNYLRPPLEGKDRIWDNLEPIVQEVFDELMAKYSFSFEEKKYTLRVSLKKVDDDGFIVDAGSETITKVYALPYWIWLDQVRGICKNIWKKTWNHRNVEPSQAIAALGYHGSGKTDLPRAYCKWLGNVPTKVKLGRLTNMEYAMLKAKGELPQDDPEALQPKATSRKRGK
jgi:hypothetical protein